MTAKARECRTSHQPHQTDSNQRHQNRRDADCDAAQRASVEDLEASDDEIREWMAKLGDPSYWSHEARSRHTQLEEAVAGQPGEPQAREVMAFLEQHR